MTPASRPCDAAARPATGGLDEAHAARWSLPSRGTKGGPMKHVARDGLIALLAVAALALVGQRRATAGGCKADGAVCRTSRSCCGTSGKNGVCVEESGAKFGVCCTPDCTGKECGDDGCGGSCGTCTAPQTCGGGGTVNVCGCTPRTTCPAGDNCGSVPDGCGGRRRHAERLRDRVHTDRPRRRLRPVVLGVLPRTERLCVLRREPNNVPSRSL